MVSSGIARPRGAEWRGSPYSPAPAHNTSHYGSSPADHIAGQYSVQDDPSQAAFDVQKGVLQQLFFKKIKGDLLFSNLGIKCLNELLLISGGTLLVFLFENSGCVAQEL